MRGHKTVIDLRKLGKKPRGLFIFMGVYPYPQADYFDPENALLRLEHPEVWVEDDDPEKADLTFIKNLVVHLIDYGGKTTPEKYFAWWANLAKAEPKLMITVDWDDQVNIWRKEDVNY